MHFSHYGRMCPIETPEGPNIGLIGALCTFARVNEFGFIETPYRVVKNGKVTQRDPLHGRRRGREVRRRPGQHADQRRRHLQGRTASSCRRSPQAASLEDLKRMLEAESFFGATTDIASVTPDEVQLMDVSPRQIVSVGTALIPFLEHDDANRALDGRQHAEAGRAAACAAEAPYIGTGIEDRAARDAGDLIQATGDGAVTEVSGDSITVNYNDGRHAASYRLSKFRRSNQDTCINHRVRVKRGRQGRQGHDPRRRSVHRSRRARARQEPARRADAVGGLQLRGRDHPLRAAREGRRADVDPHPRARGRRPRHQARAGGDQPGHPEPQSDDILRDLDDRGIIRVGAEVGPGDVLVGKVTPKGETELTPEERLLRAIFGEKAREVRDTSLKVPHGENGKVIDVKVFNREDGDELPPGVNQLVRVYVAQKRKISVGDKLAGRHGNKGVISKILPIEDMPYMADGTAVDIILNPLGVPSRMNVGQVLEAHLGYAARWGWTDVKNGTSRSATRRSAAPRPRPGRTPSRRRSSPRRCSTAPTGTRTRRPASTRPSRRSSRTSTRRSADGTAPDRHRRQDARCTTAAPATCTTTRSPSGTCTS